MSLESGSKGESSLTSAAVQQRLVIYQASSQLHCADPDAAADQIQTEVEKLGGWLQSRSGHQLALRLPHQQLRPFMKGLEGLGELRQTNISALDVTDKHTDLSMRLQNARASQLRLQELLKKQGKVEELLKVEEELKRVSEEVETLQGKINYLQHNSRFSLLSLSLHQLQAVQAQVAVLKPF